MTDSSTSQGPATWPEDVNVPDKGSVQHADQADQGDQADQADQGDQADQANEAATDLSDNVICEETSEEETARQCLSEERMNQTMSLPECTCLRLPRVVSYAEVGDPSGYPAFLLLGMDSHRYMSLLFDKQAKARGVRLICLDRPGRGQSSHFQDQRANRLLEFPEIMRLFCRAAGIRFFSLVGQSVGASYALRCAQEMPDMVATKIYLVSPWVPLSVPGSSRALYVAEKLPQWLLKAAMTMPRLVMASGGVGLIAKGCSEEEKLLMGTKTSSEVFQAVSRAKECTEGAAMDALVALEKNHSMGFDYRDMSMPVHVFHGNADHMVPIAAAEWMAEKMPACTLSVKMGGTHALIMDTGVLSCVLEFISEDFKHFEEHATGRADGEAAGERRPAFSFPKHTFEHERHFNATGYLCCREGMLTKAWKDRYFVLEGFQLYEFDEPSSSTARRVVDLRGTVAHVHTDSAEAHAAEPVQRLFPFKLVDTKHRELYNLGASTTEDRAFWMDILTKASR
ncbi:unnamed protein product, partial [Laminaria digitata]